MDDATRSCMLAMAMPTQKEMFKMRPAVCACLYSAVQILHCSLCTAVQNIGMHSVIISSAASWTVRTGRKQNGYHVSPAWLAACVTVRLGFGGSQRWPRAASAHPCARCRCVGCQADVPTAPAAC